MDEELVLLTSYFNLANGRRQDTADTFRVDPSLPSRTSPDGTAALYVITESSATGQMGPRARRLAADTVAWEYSTHADDAPAPRLRAALRAAHQEVLREFDGHVSVGLSAIAIEYDDVFLAQAAPGQVYVLHDGSLHSISADAGGPNPFARALGASAGPEISVFRDKIGPNDVLALCSSWFQRTAEPESLRECFGAGSADDIADALFELGKEHALREATVVVIEAVRGSELATGEGDDAPSSFSEQVDAAVQALAGVGRMLWGELRGQPPARNGSRDTTLDPDSARHEYTRDLEEPTSRRQPSKRAAFVQEPQIITPPDDFTSEIPHLDAEAATGGAAEAWNQQPKPWNPDETASYELTDLLPPEPEPPRERQRHATEEVPVTPTERSGSRPIPRSGLSPDRDALAPEPEPEPEPARGDEINAVNARLNAEPDYTDGIPPVQGFADPSTTEPSRIYATNREIDAVNRRPRRFGGISRGTRNDVGVETPVIRPGPTGVDLRRPMNRPAPPAAIWAGAAVLLVLIAMAAYTFLRHRSPAVVVNNHPQYAVADLRQAKASQNQGQQDTLLAAAKHEIALAQQAGSLPATVNNLRSQWQQTADTIYKVTRVTGPIVAADFTNTSGAQPAQVATGPTTLYVLDSGGKSVYSVSSNASNSSPTQIVKSGETDSGITITTPVQLTTSGDTALILDDSNNLVRSTGGTKTAIVLQKSSAAQKIVAITNYGTSIYTLDVVASQVWIYSDAVAGTGGAPTGFFPQNAPDVAQAVSLVLDDRSMYILEKSGQVLKVDSQNANRQKFAGTLRAALPGLRNPVSIFTDVGMNYVWIADPANGRIVQFDKNGNYVREYLSGTSAMDLTQIKGIVVPPGGKTLYVLSGKKLYDFPVQP